MPMPSSLTASSTNAPGAMPAWTISGASASRRDVRRSARVMVPPDGIASRALTIRFSSTCSTCAGSASTCDTDCGEIEAQLHVGADQAARHARHAADDLVEVERDRLQHLLAAERQQLPRQRGGAIGGVQDLVDLRGHRRIVLDAMRHQLGVAANRGQQVVEVVRDAAGEAADRFHLLRLAQLILELHAIADVVHGREDRALVAELGDRAERFDLDHLAVLADAAHGQLHARHALGIEARQLIDAPARDPARARTSNGDGASISSCCV